MGSPGRTFNADCTQKVFQVPYSSSRVLTDTKFRRFLTALLQKRRAGEVFAGKGTVGQAWEDTGGIVCMLMERKPHAIKVLQENFPTAIIWQDKPKTPLTASELLVLFGGPPCNDFSKAGRQRGKSRDVLWCFELAAQMQIPFLLLEITPEFMWNDSQHGQYTYLMSRLPELGYQMVSHVVDNPDLGGGSYRRRLLIAGELTCISKLLPPFSWPQLSQAAPQPLLSNLDSISSLRGTRNFASEGRFELFEHPRKDKRGATIVGVLRWGAGLPIEQGSCVYCFDRGCQGTWRVVSVVGSRVRLMAYNQPKVDTRVTVNLNTLKAKDQSLLVYGISGCGLAVTSYNEGIQGSGRILILDTRLGHNFVRILTNTEVWRLVSEAPIPEGLSGPHITDLAGASITTPMARYMAAAVNNRIDQLTALIFPVTKLSPHESLDHPARVILLPLCVAATTCLLGNGHYVGCGVRDRSHAQATLKHLWQKLDPSSIYFLVREFANSSGKIFVYAVLCKQETPMPGFSWLKIEKCGDPHVAIAWDRLQSMCQLGASALLKNLVPLSNRCHPLLSEKPLAPRVPVVFRESDDEDFLNMKVALNKVSRSCSALVRESLRYWGDAFSPPDMRDVAPEDLKTQLAESPPFAMLPFSDPCPISCTKPLPPYQFGNPPRSRHRLEDLLFPWALQKMDMWFKEEQERFRKMWEAPGKKCPPGRTLVIGPNGFRPFARGFLWQRVGPNMYEAFSKPASCSSHWDLKALDDILACYPDRELRDFVRYGVSYKVPLVSEIRLLPHLTTLGLGAHKLHTELRRLRDLGWSRPHAIHEPPYIPIHFIPRGATARKHEPDRPRGTSDYSAPHKDLYNTSGQSVPSFNRQTNHKYFHWAIWLDKVCDYLGDELVPHLLLRFNQIIKQCDGQPLIDTVWEKEVKPSVDDHVRDVAILKAMADEAGEQLYFFVDDFKDFFMQFMLAPHQRYLCCTLWFDAIDNFSPILSEEMRMAFGASPNSKIAQRFSNVLALEFTRRFNDFVQENMESLSPGLRKVIAKRSSSLNHAIQWQASPMRCKIFTDDAKFAVIGPFLTAHALRIWTELTLSFNMLMAIPAKRAFSQSVKWLGLMWHARLAIVTLPKTRRLDLLALLHQFISGKFIDEARNTFEEYRSMVGKMSAVRSLLDFIRADTSLLYAPYRRGNRLGPASRPVLYGRVIVCLQKWQRRLKQHASMSFYHTHSAMFPLYRSIQSYVLVYTDACKEENLTALGVFAHGYVNHTPFPDYMCSLEISHLELIAAVCGFFLALKVFQVPRIILFSDATSACAALGQNAKSLINKIIISLWLETSCFRTISHGSAVAWVPGETTVLADAASRNNFDFLKEWAAIQGMTLRRVDIPNFENFMKDIYKELSNNTSGLLTGPEYSSDDIGGGPETDWKAICLARCLKKAKTESGPLSIPNTLVVSQSKTWRGLHLRRALKSTGYKAHSVCTEESLRKVRSQGFVQTLVSPPLQVQLARPPPNPPRISVLALGHQRRRPLPPQHLCVKATTSRLAPPGAYMSLPPELAEKLDEYRLAGVPSNTRRQQDTSWQYWAAYCCHMNVDSWRKDVAAHMGLNPNAHRREQELLLGFLAFLPQVMQRGRTFTSEGVRKDVKPQTIKGHYDAVRAAHKARGIEMAGVPQFTVIYKGMLAKYVQKWGSKALLTKSRLPFTRSMLVQLFSLAPGTKLTGCTVGSKLWEAFVIVAKVAASTGFRLDEVCNADFAKGGRNHLRWMVNGILYDELSVPQLLALKAGDYAVLAPFASKTDRANARWGNNSIYLPYDESCPLNAAVALKQLELDWPVKGLQRANAPCFPMNAPLQTWSSKTLYWLLRSALLKIMPKSKVTNYSFHSFRTCLATALKKAGVGTEDIMQHLRWASPNSVPIYARDDPQAYGRKVSLALQQNFAAFKSTTQGESPLEDAELSAIVGDVPATEVIEDVAGNIDD